MIHLLDKRQQFRNVAPHHLLLEEICFIGILIATITSTNMMMMTVQAASTITTTDFKTSLRRTTTSSIHEKQRHLIPVSAKNKDSWPECVFPQDRYTPDECLEWITRDVQTHTLKNIVVKIASPRSDEQLAESSHLVGVFTNYLGDVIGRFHNGIVEYPFTWEGTGPEGTREVGPWDCSGMDALECCYDIILADVTDSNTQGNYMQCFVSEQGVEVDPHPNGSTTEVAYYTWIYNSDQKQHERTEITLEDMHTQELLTQELLEPARATMEGMTLQGYALTEEVETLTKDLQLSARAYELGPAMNVICELAALVRHAQEDGSINDPTMDVTEGSDLANLFEQIEFHIAKYEAQGIHPGAYVVIRTNSNGEISHLPELEIDYRLPSTSNTNPDGNEIPTTDSDTLLPPTLPEEPTFEGDVNFPPPPPCDPEDPFCSGGPGGPGGPGGNLYYAGGEFGEEGPGKIPKYCRKIDGDLEKQGTCQSVPCVSDWDCPNTKSWICNYDCSPIAGSNTGESKSNGDKNNGGGGPK